MRGEYAVMQLDGAGPSPTPAGAVVLGFPMIATAQRINLRFQSQISNLLNHPNYGNPVTDLNHANYGKIQSLTTSGDYGPRRVLFGLRLTF